MNTKTKQTNETETNPETATDGTAQIPAWGRNLFARVTALENTARIPGPKGDKGDPGASGWGQLTIRQLGLLVGVARLALLRPESQYLSVQQVVASDFAVAELEYRARVREGEASESRLKVEEAAEHGVDSATPVVNESGNMDARDYGVNYWHTSYAGMDITIRKRQTAMGDLYSLRTSLVRTEFGEPFGTLEQAQEAVYNRLDTDEPLQWLTNTVHDG